MRYNEQINLKLFKYENSAFVQEAIVDDYQEISFVHNLYEAGDFTITINYNIPNALKFERGMFVQFGNDSYMFGEIRTVSDAIGEDGKGSQIRTITGKDARFLFNRRIIKNLNNEENWVMTAKGELCLRNLIADQCGSNAETKRQLPIINTIPTSENAIGKEYSVAESFSNLYDTLVTVATQSEIGWRVKFDGNLTLEVYQGSDLSNTVQFSTDFDSLSNGQFSDSSESFANTIYVGGKGTGNDRDIYEGENAIEGESPAGLDRFEAWDNQSSMTTESEYEAEALSMLNQYGQTINVSGNGLAKCPYEFQKEYNIGDTITLGFSGKSAKVQILSVTEHWVWGQYGIEFTFGKPQNDLSRQLQLILKQIQKASNKTKTTESVKYYTIPTDTAMPSSDVVYDRIGFTGACASGGSTFTLYLDDEKTGAKTYHVYFKELTGGNLTLTTGKPGAQDLVMNSGTYVSIIYVDAEGNVSCSGMTSTNAIESGNNQPVTSGAVAEQTEVTKSSDSIPYSQRVNADKDKSFINKLIGASFANNQIVQNGNFTSISSWTTGSATFTVSGNVASIVTSSNYGGIYQALNIRSGHKYLISVDIRATTANQSVRVIVADYNTENPIYLKANSTTSYVTYQGVVTSSITKYLVVGSNGIPTTVNAKNVFFIDLTQMFGSVIADRIYAMEQAAEGSGIAWIRFFGFFNNDYYATNEGSIQSSKPSAYRTSTSVAKWFISRNVSSQYINCLYAEAVLKPNTNYTLYFRGANGAKIYTNENIFTTIGSATLNGSLQSMTLKTKTELPYSSSTRFNNGWIIFKNNAGNTVVPNFTEFYIVEEGVNAEHSFSQIATLADTELRGLPKLDANNNLYFDGDVYYPNGDVIRKYGVVDLGSLTWAYNSPSEGINTFYTTNINSLIKAPATNNDIPNVICALYPAISWSDVHNSQYGVSVLYGGQLRISDPDNTYNKNPNTFKTAMNGVYLVYELITPTKETVAGYSNPHILIRNGAEEFVDTRTIPLPVGHETEYAQLPSWLSNNDIFL